MKAFGSLLSEDALLKLRKERKDVPRVDFDHADWLMTPFDEDDYDEELSTLQGYVANDMTPPFTPRETNHPYLNGALVRNTISRTIVAIVSNIGDDFVASSLTTWLGNYIIQAFEFIEMKISKEDTGHHPYLINYAEGWYGLPPTTHAGTEANCVGKIPWIYDVPRMRHISPVRKQSALELDLASKCGQIFRNAAWTNVHWPSRPWHEVFKIIALISFDLSESVSLPILFESEGGCGGEPPFGNILSWQGMLYHFRRGRIRQTAIALMRETRDVLRLVTAPQATTVVSVAHLAMSGVGPWKRLAGVIENARNAGWNQPSLEELSRVTRGIPVPTEIKDLEIDVPNTNVYVGLALARLRKEGVIYTTTDVLAHLQKVERLKAVAGDKPMGLVIAQQEAEKEKWKRQAFNQLEQFWSKESESTESMIDQLPLWSSPEATDIMHGYYRSHIELLGSLSSFLFQRETRIYLKSEVDERTGMRMNFRLTEFLDLDPYDWDQTPVYDIQRESRWNFNPDEFRAWVEAVKRSRTVTTAPEGLAADDARMLDELIICIQESRTHEEQFLFVTDDYRFRKTIENFVRSPMFLHYPRCACIGVDDYLRETSLIVGPPPIGERSNCYDFAANREKPLPKSLRRAMGSALPVKVVYDRPNIYSRIYAGKHSRTLIKKPRALTVKRAQLFSRMTPYTWTTCPDTDVYHEESLLFASENVYPTLDDSVRSLASFRLCTPLK